ncbi:vacuolar sorting protein [Scheffersomyces amazonensis]|uniref:vacuolar sorting protein n=1 Tax=Scheffersomyces amazonensis TaxID=1078765 RepID=UPI00315D910C
MASSIPYLPDDFEDNNPSAEPIDQEITQNPFVEPSILSQPLPYDEHEDTPEIETSEPNENVQLPQSETDENQIGKLSEAELRKLVPERFTTKYQLSIKLLGIEKNKVGNPILRFDAFIKGLPRYRQNKYKDIRRTYNEVVKFNKYLTVSNLEVFIPVFPNATTSYPFGSEDEFKQLMYVWQEWFNRITCNPILIRDEEFIYFIENDFGYSVINTQRKTNVASGLVRKTLKQLAVPYDPYQELADFRPLIKAAYLICQKLYKSLDKSSKLQKQISIQVFDLSNKLGVLSQFENSHPGMKNMWEKLSKIVQINSDLDLIESINEMGSLGDGIQGLVDDFYEIKEALTNRHLIMRELIQAESQTQAKHLQATKIKNRSALDPIKVDEAIRQLEYATKAEESLNLQVKRISGEMLFEKDEIINFTEAKFQKLLKNYTLNKVEYHRKILKHLENIRLDVRIVDTKGGLSRLNRDNLTSLKHNLPSSQSANGDSWSSRTFRSLKKEEEEREHKLQQEQYDDEEDEEGDDNNHHDNTNIDDHTTSHSKGVVDARNAAHLLGVATF